MRRTTRYIALAAVILWAGTWTVAYGQTGNCYGNLAGCLDASFGTGGLVTTPGMSAAVHDVAFQNIDGQQLIVATPGLGASWTLARYLPNGALDTSFGKDGFVTRTYKNNYSTVRHVAVQPDNCLVVAGSVPYGKPTVQAFAVGRYLPNGEPDPTFGAAGLVVVPMLVFTNKTSSAAHDVAVLPDGTIIAVGNAGALVVAIRLDRFGNIDKTFGNTTPKKDGKFIHRDCYGTAEEMAIQPDGRIVIAGKTNLTPYSLYRATVMRLTPTGQLDTGFANRGLAILEAPGEANWYYNGMALDPATGAILAAGTVGPVGDSTHSTLALLARYLADGSLDPSFGSGGKVLHQWASGNNFYEDVDFQPDGRILVVGSVGPDVITMPPDRHLIVSAWRFLADGSPDATFGQNGWVTTSFPNMGDIAWCLAQQGDGKFVVGASGFALLRYFQ